MIVLRIAGEWEGEGGGEGGENRLIDLRGFAAGKNKGRPHDS